MNLFDGYDFRKKPPSWIFHPLKRYKFNKLIKDISIANDIINTYCDEKKLNKLAILSLYSDKTNEFVITYCDDDSGDTIRHRKTYIFDGSNNLDNTDNKMNFIDTVLRHNK